MVRRATDLTVSPPLDRTILKARDPPVIYDPQNSQHHETPVISIPHHED
jgi:hypothetical protein